MLRKENEGERTYNKNLINGTNLYRGTVRTCIMLHVKVSEMMEMQNRPILFRATY